MKTNVSIELSDEQRDVLADILDGKVTKRLATRKEVVELCEQHIERLLGGMAKPEPSNKVVLATATNVRTDPDLQHKVDPSLRIDPEDRVALAGKDAGYIRGWNMVKHR